MKKTILLILLLNISNVFAVNPRTLNIMKCNFSTSSSIFTNTKPFDQFCYIDPSLQNVKTSFNDIFVFNLDSLNAKIQSSLSDFINVNSVSELISSSLTPYLTFDYNWNGTKDCWSGGLYNTSVYVYINNIKTQQPLMPNPNNGYTKFREPLLNWQSQTDNASNKVSISTQFRIINEKGTIPTPEKKYSWPQPMFYHLPSPIRQPKQCQFNISNVQIEFDRSSIADSLARLKNQYTTLNRLVITELMLNSALLNTQINNKLIIVQAIDMAQNIEGVITSELSLAVQEYLSFLVSTADANHTFNLNGTDPFIWLVNNEAKLRQEIAMVKETNRFPQKESFMQEGKIINQQGYENAINFANDYEQLMSIIKLGWTFANLTGDAMALAKLPDNSWLYQVPLN